MTATTVLPPDAAAYLDAVRESLADLPAVERDDLLAEVETSLLDSVAEGGAVAAQLGPPEEFAAELRAAAGLHPPAPTPVPARPWWKALAPPLGAVRALASELAPIWWVIRGYVLVAAAALAAGAAWRGRPALVPSIDSAADGAAVVAVAVVLSVAAGVVGRRRGIGRAATLANVVLAAAAVPVAVHLARIPPQPVAAFTVQTPVVAGLAYDGVPVENLYPYSRSGRLLQDVLLFDGAGRALDVRRGSNDPERRVLRTRGGRSIFNSFPVRYYEPGTLRVARPGAGPPVRIPRIVTPPLRPRATGRRSRSRPHASPSTPTPTTSSGG